MFLKGFILALGFLAGVAAAYIVYTILSIWLQGIKIRKDIEKIGRQVLEEAKADGIKTKGISSN